MAGPLQVEHWMFWAQNREAWLKAPESQLRLMRPSFLTRILAEKAAVRPHRSFGEAFVARRMQYEEAWYSSFKWLTSGAWVTQTEEADYFREEFKRALRHYFPNLHQLQARARAFVETNGIRPVPPDLWLVRRREHWFVEVKVWPDDVSDAQAAGLALIRSGLPSALPTRTAVVYLYEASVLDDCRRPDPTPKFREYFLGEVKQQLMSLARSPRDYIPTALSDLDAARDLIHGGSAGPFERVGEMTE